MVIDYTVRWNNFQIRSTCNICSDVVDPYTFDVVKWEQHKPYEVVDGRTGEKKMSTEHCFTIGTLIWNPKEEEFEFESVGLRYLEDREDKLEEWLIAFCKMKAIELKEN